MVLSKLLRDAKSKSRSAKIGLAVAMECLLVDSMKNKLYSRSKLGGGVRGEESDGFVKLGKFIPLSGATATDILAGLLGSSSTVKLKLRGNHSIFDLCEGLLHDARQKTISAVVYFGLPPDRTADPDMPAWIKEMGKRKRELASRASTEEHYRVVIQPDRPTGEQRQDGLLMVIARDGTLLSFIAGRYEIGHDLNLIGQGGQDVIQSFGQAKALELATALIHEIATKGIKTSMTQR